ncbi:MAG: hypothetical protein U0V56_11775 [Actinomycetota bacterium]
MGTSFAAIAGVMPRLVEAFRTGAGVVWDAYGEDMTRAQGDFNRPWLRGRLASEYMPSVTELHDRLVADPPARVLDVACGVGWAGSPWRARTRRSPSTPWIRTCAIELARAYAEEAGVADRVTHRATDAADPTLEGGYDLAIVVESIHDLSYPVSVLTRIAAPPARRHADRGGRAYRGSVHGTGERDGAFLLRIQRALLPAGRDG